MNEKCECFNAMLIGMLCTLPRERKTDWKGKVNTLVPTYSCTCNVTMGFSPYDVIFGHHPWLPLNIQFGVCCIFFCLLYQQVCAKHQNHIVWTYHKVNFYIQH